MNKVDEITQLQEIAKLGVKLARLIYIAAHDGEPDFDTYGVFIEAGLENEFHDARSWQQIIEEMAVAFIAVQLNTILAGQPEILRLKKLEALIIEANEIEDRSKHLFAKASLTPDEEIELTHMRGRMVSIRKEMLLLTATYTEA